MKTTGSRGSEHSNVSKKQTKTRRTAIADKANGIKQPSIPVTIATVLREKILSGKLAGGARIIEGRISGDFGVGQPSVREALFILERQGLVQRVANLGTFVTEMDARDVREIYEIRKALEGLAFELVALRATTAELAELSAMVTNMEEAALEKGKRGYLETDLAFHRRVWELTGNKQLAKILEQIVVPVLAFSFLKIDRDKSDLKAGVHSHATLLKALKAGPEQARTAMEKSLDYFLQRYFSYILPGVLGSITLP